MRGDIGPMVGPPCPSLSFVSQSRSVRAMSAGRVVLTPLSLRGLPLVRPCVVTLALHCIFYFCSSIARGRLGSKRAK